MRSQPGSRLEAPTLDRKAAELRRSEASKLAAELARRSTSVSAQISISHCSIRENCKEFTIVGARLCVFVRGDIDVPNDAHVIRG